MLRERIAVFELELLLSALLRRCARDATARFRVAQDFGAILLIDQDSSLFLCDATRQRGAESIVDHALGFGNLVGLFDTQRSSPAEHPACERSTVVERQNEQPLRVTRHHLQVIPDIPAIPFISGDCDSDTA